ncbi:hypothetical protein HYZ97_00045, partial [Candidatus Pacearchaeota archaeon]|nr:hypothetical protein [Candidatus Pacearchaeota archaeon]
MEHKLLWGIGLGIVLLAALLFFLQPKLSPSDIRCNPLSVNNPEGINIVFFGKEEQAQKYASLLLKVEPLASHSDAFNLYQIDQSPECELYKGIALFCHSRALLKDASACPNDYVIVLKEQPTNIRSSAYQNIMSVNTKSPDTTIAHEFGHAFANLAEEYTPATLPSKSRNCVSSCDAFTEETDGCFQGCSK